MDTKSKLGEGLAGVELVLDGSVEVVEVETGTLMMEEVIKEERER